MTADAPHADIILTSKIIKMMKKLIEDPEPKCPKCHSVDVAIIPPKKRLTGDYKAFCRMCGFTGNLDKFYETW